MTGNEIYELVLLRSLARLRHLYQQMAGGHAHVDQASISRIAEHILAPVIRGLEDLTSSIRWRDDPNMDLTDFPPE